MPDVKELTKHLADASARDRELVEHAYAFAEAAHEGHTRYSGEPYFNHVFATACSLAELGAGPKTITAGLLHDVIEDADVSEAQLREEFGDEVLFLVQGVTKLGTVRYRGLQRHVESLRKLFVAMSQDVRVIIVKLMDRLHNIRTLEYVPEHKRERIALETLEIYVPIAERLGMSKVQHELEDGAFRFAYPEEYTQTLKLRKEKSKENQAHLDKMHKSLKKELAARGIRNFRTESRIKGLYSLYKKLQRKKGDISKIRDISAVRVIVPSVNDCYTVLGVIHNLWRPLPGKIKDYIAVPKPNGYRSLHTTVFTGDGGIIEIQIRTEDMHREAEYGIASHGWYTEESDGKRAPRMTNFQWFRELLSFPGIIGSGAGESEAQSPVTAAALRTPPEWMRALADAQAYETESVRAPHEFLNSLKSDFFTHRIFVFTPAGDVVDLPLDATVLDFAYAIHSDIGDHAAGAQVNGKQCSLSTPLKNADIVSIQTKTAARPTRKWLDYAKTSLARKHIRAALSTDTKKAPSRTRTRKATRRTRAYSETYRQTKSSRNT